MVTPLPVLPRSRQTSRAWVTSSERALLRVFGVRGSTRTTPGRDAIASSFEASVVTATPGKTRVVENSTLPRVARSEKCLARSATSGAAWAAASRDAWRAAEAPRPRLSANAWVAEEPPSSTMTVTGPVAWARRVDSGAFAVEVGAGF